MVLRPRVRLVWGQGADGEQGNVQQWGENHPHLSTDFLLAAKLETVARATSSRVEPEVPM